MPNVFEVDAEVRGHGHPPERRIESDFHYYPSMGRIGIDLTDATGSRNLEIRLNAEDLAELKAFVERSIRLDQYMKERWAAATAH